MTRRYSKCSTQLFCLDGSSFDNDFLKYIANCGNGRARSSKNQVSFHTFEIRAKQASFKECNIFLLVSKVELKATLKTGFLWSFDKPNSNLVGVMASQTLWHHENPVIFHCA